MQPAHLSEPVFARLANSVWAFSQDYWRLVVAAMLATLHVAVFRGVADPWARALLLVHLGLLLLWQPFLRAAPPSICCRLRSCSFWRFRRSPSRPIRRR